MNLRLDGLLGERYPGATQWARTVTEGWAGENLYCIACESPRLTAYGANQAVEDFHCPSCGRRVQLKAKNGKFGRVVRGSAYETQARAIRENRVPDYCFLGYDRQRLAVRHLFWVPGHFITPSVIVRCNPLKPEARRAGWVGSNILLHQIPEQGKIALVVDGVPRNPLEVRRQFRATSFLQGMAPEERGWIGDVLDCVNDIAAPGQDFTTGDLYAMDDWRGGIPPTATSGQKSGNNCKCWCDKAWFSGLRQAGIVSVDRDGYRSSFLAPCLWLGGPGTKFTSATWPKPEPAVQPTALTQP